jgi:hypothetical protein
MSTEKLGFVIAPIGEEGSEIRKRSDQVFKHVIEPIAHNHGYRAAMAHQMAKPGSITTQIVEQILNAPLVVADLTGHNANVLYELAIRHVVRKPVVQIIKKGENLPFDIAQQRTISLDHTDLDSVETAKQELSKQIDSVEQDPSQVDSPISVAVDLSMLRRSTTPIEPTLVEIVSLLQEIKRNQQSLAGEVQFSTMSDLFPPNSALSLSANENRQRLQSSQYGAALRAIEILARDIQAKPGAPTSGSETDEKGQPTP